jgi:hypothetical protein
MRARTAALAVSAVAAGDMKTPGVAAAEWTIPTPQIGLVEQTRRALLAAPVIDVAAARVSAETGWTGAVHIATATQSGRQGAHDADSEHWLIRGSVDGVGAAQEIWVSPLDLVTTPAWQVSPRVITATEDVLRHEIAHLQVRDTCGTAAPEIAGGRFEHVADAWAVTWLGARSSDPGGYGFTTTDLEVAREIHDDGKCE